MKRRELIRHLKRHGCELLREGGKHTIYVNRGMRKTSSVPRHREVNEYLGAQERKSQRISKCQTHEKDHV